MADSESDIGWGRPPVILLMGPTAAGKTGLALELVARFPLDIISVDSAQVYRGMDIGTAKPDAATLKRAPHHLIDIRDPEDSYSAAAFRADALALIERSHQAGRVPLLAGGTMLYFRALRQGLAPMPDADPVLRRRLEQRAESLGAAAMHDWLASVDAEAAARIHPNDPQRVQRALEVFLLTGRPQSHWHAADEGAEFPYDMLSLVINPEPRAVLHERIAQRFEQMLEAGFLQEVETLRRRPGLRADSPAMRAVGYRQAWAHLAGDYGYEEMIRRGVAATRQLAKRQLTWLRREKRALWYDLQAKSARSQALAAVRSLLEKPRR